MDPTSMQVGRVRIESLCGSEMVVLEGTVVATAVAEDKASSASEDMYAAAVLDAGTRTVAAQDGVPESLHS